MYRVIKILKRGVVAVGRETKVSLTFKGKE